MVSSFVIPAMIVRSLLLMSPYYLASLSFAKCRRIQWRFNISYRDERVKWKENWKKENCFRSSKRSTEIDRPDMISADSGTFKICDCLARLQKNREFLTYECTPPYLILNIWDGISLAHSVRGLNYLKSFHLANIIEVNFTSASRTEKRSKILCSQRFHYLEKSFPTIKELKINGKMMCTALR